MSHDPFAAATSLAITLGLAGPSGRGSWRLGPVDLVPLAVGWATVEAERATRELVAVGPFTRTADDDLLGASAWATEAPIGGSGPDPGPIAVVLLEPLREGRLAASLARRGEGWTVLYALPVGGARAPGAAPATDGTASDAIARLGAMGIRIRTGASALGPGGLVVTADAAGPRLVIVGRAGPTAGSRNGRGSPDDGVPSGP